MGLYYQTPGLNIAPRSQQALEFRFPTPSSTGASAPGQLIRWPLNHGLSLSCAEKQRSESFRDIAAITGVRPQGPWGKLVDLIS